MAAITTSHQFAPFLVCAIPILCTYIIPTEAFRFRGDTGHQDLPSEEAPNDNQTVTEPTFSLPPNGSGCPNQQQCCVVYGSPGPQGPPGSVGVAGTRGVPGSNGNQGMRGERGEDGPPGLPGPTGSSGIRGRPGSNGLPGARGEKGDVGLGEPGLPGIQGMKGNQGDVGGVGSPGPVGIDGLNGRNGQKGEPGEDHSALPVSAFYLGRHSNLLVTSGSRTITFDTEFTNEGNDISGQTGTFICRIPGLYFFSYNFRAYSHASYGLNIDLVVNNHKKAEIYMNGMGKNVMQSQSALLNLAENDRVWLKAYASTYIWGCPTHNTFTGYLIRASSSSEN